MTAAKRVGSRNSVARLIEKLKSRDWEVRLEAIEKSGELPATLRRRLLMLGCADVSEVVRVASINEMERSTDAAFRPVLLAALSDRSVLVRAHAVICLPPISTADDIAVLKHHLPTARSIFRIALLWALTAVGQPSFFEALLKSVAATGEYHEACMGARLVSTLKLDAAATQRVSDLLRSVRDRFNAAAVDDAVAEALSRLARKTSGTKRR